MPNIFQRKKLVKSIRQAPNLGRLLCRSKFETQHKNYEVKNCGKNCASCSYVLSFAKDANKNIKEKQAV